MADVCAKCADVGAFGAVDAEGRVGKIHGEELEGEYGDFAWFPLDGDALARQLIEGLAVLLDGGLDQPPEMLLVPGDDRRFRLHGNGFLGHSLLRGLGRFLTGLLFHRAPFLFVVRLLT